MILAYLRSSSISTLEFCEMKYFLTYTLGMRDRTGKKACLGTIFHRAMQILGDKKIAIRDGKKTVQNDDIPNLRLAKCDDLDYITKLCFDYYASIETDLDFTPADLKLCRSWVHKAVAHNNGRLDPRNQNVYITEKFFDIEIPHTWAGFDYEIDGKKISGKLSIKGTVDLIIDEGNGYFQVLDYKTGKRLNWATGKEKTYSDLQKDPQLLLYYYALKNLYPENDFYMSIYYVNDGGVFDVVFTEKDYIKAENMLKQKFQYIKSTTLPKQLSSDQSHWKCQKLCKFSEIFENTDKTTCQFIHDEIKLHGIDSVTATFGDLDRVTKYGAGGGRLEGANE